ncbi:hypothetical protein L3Q82_005474 [Scortum barcoo]|uniref:Uncharacterized protein n=1 Tax=Scortum barcoo TaxID=214431 RepID=A0ACB8VA16_9TELE|nr:hypothetical protein L3Q82_005474 [Scortum barcoo]
MLQYVHQLVANLLFGSGQDEGENTATDSRWDLPFNSSVRVRGRANRTCALRGSSVDLPCPNTHTASGMEWYTEHWNGVMYVLSEVFADENFTKYRMPEEGNFTLTIKDLRESDEKIYCCGNKPRYCELLRTKLHVTDLQVKVIPSTEGQTVTLMCSTSCALTENPAVYIWYKNGEFLYEDWSPWYQQLVSSDKSVRYSCAIKGYEDLRAPDVSVDSVTPTCFSVTYAKGKMCSFKQKSEDEPCSITYPTEVYVQRFPLEDHSARLTCATSCPLADNQTSYRWYRNKHPYRYFEGPHLTVTILDPYTADFSCAIKGHEDLLSAAVCADDTSCRTLNYVSRRICTVEGSSVNISSEYLYPQLFPPQYKFWYRRKKGSNEDAEKLTGDTDHIEYHENMTNLHILRINNLKTNDSAEYIFRLQHMSDEGWKLPGFPGVTLVVTGLKVTFAPSAVVTEGQRVTLSCSTSCPLTDNTNYIWYFNSGPLTPPQNRSKHLVLDPVSSQHEGRYSCAVKTQTDIRSPEETLTVVCPVSNASHVHLSPAPRKSVAVINAIRLTIAVLIPIPLLLFHLWMRRDKDYTIIRLLNYLCSDEKMKSTTAMLLAEAGCVFIGFILYFSGVQGRENKICALRGSSVDLPCSAEHHTSSMKWYIAQWNGSKHVQNEIPADEKHITYNILEESRPTLTIKVLRESDAKFYCCRETDKPGHCWLSKIELHVADLQVKVIPSTEGQTVTLMCSTSCALTENPAAYIWYKNGEFLYEDWSPWYQQLVSSDKSVRYSCAIKGYEDLRAPEVSVDSVTPTCFNVTYAKGRMCLFKQTSEDEPCSITYPTEVRIERTSSSKDDITLTCNTSCPLTHPQTAYKWYKSKHVYRYSERQELFLFSPTDESFFCAVKGLEDLRSAETCIGTKSCWRVNYVSRRICALQGSSVTISSEYWYPDNQRPKSKLWYKIKGQKDAEQLTEDAGHVEYHNISENHHILRIKDVNKNYSAGYTFRLLTDDGGWKQSDLSVVTLIVTGLKVTLAPSAVVTEGQRVTLSCSTSCPLTDNTNYIWYLNSRPLTPPQNQNKHLVLDPVSSQHEGNYSCAVETDTQYVISQEETLTVQVLLYLWMRKKKTLTSLAECGTLKTGQMDSGYNNISLTVINPRTAAQGKPAEPLPGVQGRANSICAFKGSSVDLPCSAEHPNSFINWYTVDGNTRSEISANGNRVSYKTTEDGHLTLTIKNLTKSDTNIYCCRNATTKRCQESGIQLTVSDLQVKVIPSTEGQTVTLMCSTSCALTENPAAYIWYKNGEFLYEDWSPWYQQLVSSDKSVRYSCAIKGYEDLRAPEVSVDSVTSTCFSVTYAKGRMCSYKQRSEDEPCSITYPTEVHVQRGSAETYVTMTCFPSCPTVDPKTAYKWYWNRQLYSHCEDQDITLFQSYYDIYSCAVKGQEALHSDEVCTKHENCWSVNYVSRRICALEGSSVNISSIYSLRNNQKPMFHLWYKIKGMGQEGTEKLTTDAGYVEYHSVDENHHVLGINDVRKNDSAEYIFRPHKLYREQSYLSGVTLVVTGLKVTFAPSAVVTEGQRVTLSCSTSCPLTDNTNYIWYLNSRPLTPPQNQNKHLVLDPVYSQHAGNYSCAVETPQNIISLTETLSVKAREKTMLIVNAAKMAGLSLIVSAVLLLYLVKRRKKRQTSTSKQGDKVQTRQVDSVYDSIRLVDRNRIAQNNPAVQQEDTV